jgi:transposase
MGRMAKAARAVTAERRAEVEAELRRTDLVPRVRERLEMVKARALGYDLEAIAAWSGRSVRTVRHWLGRFGAGGVAALADAPRAGRPVKAGAAYLRALETAAETPPPALGLPFDVWTSDRLSAYLAQTTGVRIAPGWLRASEAHAEAPAGSGRSRRRPGRTGRGGGKRWRPSRTGTSFITRMRPTWRPTRT